MICYPRRDPPARAERSRASFVAKPDVLRAFLAWSSGSSGHASPVSQDLVARLTRLLDDETCAASRLEPLQQSRATTTTRHPPVPGELAQIILQQVGLRHVPARVAVTDVAATVFALPTWLARNLRRASRPSPTEPETSPGFLRVRLRGDAPDLAIGDEPIGSPADHGAILRAVGLRPKAPSRHRRQRIEATARTLLGELEAVLGPSARDAGWLRRMLDDPEATEAAGLRIWNDFVEACRIPESFRRPNRCLSLADLLVLRRAGEAGRHREMLAEHQPWATRQVLDGGDPEADLSPVDRNPANSINVVAKLVCCTGNADCKKAVRFARLLPRHRLVDSLDRILGVPAADRDKKVRALLLEACSQDTELLTHIRRDLPRTRARFRRAIDVFYAYHDGTRGGLDCSYALAALLVRTMVRDAFAPEQVDPDALAAGLAAVSADSLAAFAASRLDNPSASHPEPDADMLDTGVLAFISHVGATARPRLTTKQLIRFADAVRHRSIHRFEATEVHVPEDLPPPPGWTGRRSPVPGASVRALTSLGAMLREGRDMRNCLRDKRYHLPALLGQLAFFSIAVGNDRATLALRPLAESPRRGQIRLTGWTVHELRGPLNRDPSRSCATAALSVKDILDRACPYKLPQEEIGRRRAARDAFDRARSFNKDVVEANTRWVDIYRGHLPRSFEASPREIVARYLNDAD